MAAPAAAADSDAPQTLSALLASAGGVLQPGASPARRSSGSGDARARSRDDDDAGALAEALSPATQRLITDWLGGRSSRRTTGGAQLPADVVGAVVDFIVEQDMSLTEKQFALERDQAKTLPDGEGGFCWDTVQTGAAAAAAAAQGKPLSLGRRMALKRRISAFSEHAKGDENADAQALAAFAADWGNAGAGAAAGAGAGSAAPQPRGPPRLASTTMMTPLALLPLLRQQLSLGSLFSPLETSASLAGWQYPAAEAAAEPLKLSRQRRRRPAAVPAPPAPPAPPTRPPAPEGYSYCPHADCVNKPAILGLLQHINRYHKEKDVELQDCTRIRTDNGKPCTATKLDPAAMKEHLRLRKHATPAEAAAMDCRAEGCGHKAGRLNLLHSHIRKEHKAEEEKGAQGKGAHKPLFDVLRPVNKQDANGEAGGGADAAPDAGATI